MGYDIDKRGSKCDCEPGYRGDTGPGGIGKGLDGLLAIEKGARTGAVQPRWTPRTTLSPRLGPYGYKP